MNLLKHFVIYFSLFFVTMLPVFGLENFQKASQNEAKNSLKLQVDSDVKFLHYRFNNRDYSKLIRDKADWTQGVFNLGIAVEPSNEFRFISDLQYSRLFGNNGNSGETNYDSDTFRVHEAYFGWAPKDWEVNIGRQSWNYSEGFIISSFEDEVGVSYDGGKITRETNFEWLNQVDFLFAINADRNASLLSSHDPGRTSSEEHDERLFGLYLVGRRDSNAFSELDLYVLHSQYGHSKSATDPQFMCSTDPTTSARSCNTGTRNVVPKYFQTIGLRVLLITNEYFTLTAEGGVQTGKTQILRDARGNSPKQGNLQSKASHLTGTTTVKDLSLSLGWEYASGSDPVDEWNSSIKGWQPLYHRGSYTFGKNGILAFTNSNDYYVKFRYDFLDNLKSEIGMHKISFNNFRLGPVYAAENRAESPDNSIEYSQKDNGANTNHSSDLGEVYDLGVTCYLSRKINLKSSLMLHNPGKFYKNNSLASLVTLEAAYRF